MTMILDITPTRHKKAPAKQPLSTPQQAAYLGLLYAAPQAAAMYRRICECPGIGVTEANGGTLSSGAAERIVKLERIGLVQVRVVSNRRQCYPAIFKERSLA